MIARLRRGRELALWVCLTEGVALVLLLILVLVGDLR
jgi:hypothetical protein